VIERIKITDRDQWLAMRGRDVTASVIGCLLGVHEYQTAYGLWALKSGAIAADPEETGPMRRGRLLEPVAIQLLREERPTWKFQEPGVYLRDTEARIGATPDLFAYDPERGPGLVQIKTIEPSVFSRKWRDPETKEISPPLWIAVQGIIEAHLAGVEWVDVAPMRVGFGLDIELVPVPIHKGIIERAYEVVGEFWQMIAEGRKPAPDYGRDGEIIARLFEEDHGTEIDLSRDNRVPELLAERATLKTSIGVNDDRVDEIDNEVKAKLGSHAAGRLANGKYITWKTQHRKAYSVEPKSFRTLRYPKDAT